MGFKLPWRLLIPPGSVDTVIGTDSGLELARKTGATVTVSTTEEAPVTLSDKIVKIEGTVPEQEEALTCIVAELFEFQGTAEDEDGLCVLVMPSSAVGAIIGAKGSKISEIMADSGADIDVGRECIIGMPDNPVVLRGQPKQIVRAAVLCNAVLQELAEKGRIQPEDFCYIPGRTPRLTRGSLSSFPARFLVEKDFAGFLIGKGGDKIKRLRDQTGATLQFRGPAEEVTFILSPDQRVLDIRGAVNERNEAVKACFSEMDAASIQTTRLLLPLGFPEVPLQETVKGATAASCATGVSVEFQDDILSPESRERVVLLTSPDSSVRLAAVLALLAKAEAYEAPKEVPQTQTTQATQATVHPVHPVHPHPPQVPKVSSPEHKQPSQVDGEKRLEPESGNVYTFQEFCQAFAGKYSEKDIQDYWRDACQPAPDGHQDPKHQQGGKEVDLMYVDSDQKHKEQAEHAEPEQKRKHEHVVNDANENHISTKSEHNDGAGHPGPSGVQVQTMHKPRARHAGTLWADSPRSELHLLLPTHIVKGPLMAHGQLADIADGCNVEVQICAEVSHGKLQVIVKGSLCSIAMATVAFQTSIAFASCWDQTHRLRVGKKKIDEIFCFCLPIVYFALRVLVSHGCSWADGFILNLAMLKFVSYQNQPSGWDHCQSLSPSRKISKRLPLLWGHLGINVAHCITLLVDRSATDMADETQWGVQLKILNRYNKTPLS